MRGATHLAFAGLVGVVGAGLGMAPGVAGAAGLAVGALLPDIDTSMSSIGRHAKPLSSLIERKLGHRTLTHSFLGLVIVGAVASPLLLIAPAAWAWLLVGALSHVLLDTANITGVPLLWPARIEFVLVHNRGTRVAYGSPREHWWFAAFVLGALLLAPLARDGFTPWFHRLLATPTGAVQDYLRWRDRFEVWADVRGHNLLMGEAVHGAYRVIDALHAEQLVVEDEAGRAYRVGLRADSDITVQRVAARRGKPIVARTDRFEVGGRTVAELVAALPRGALRVYVTGTLVLHGDAPELPAVAGWLRRVEVIKGETQVRSAAPADLAMLAQAVVERGSLVVRAEYAPGTSPTPVELPPEPGHVFTIRLPRLPGLHALLVGVGDEVVAGQVIARHHDEEALARAEDAAARAERALAAAQAALASAEEVAALEQAGWARAVAEAAGEAERVRRLVEVGARPGAEATEASRHLDAARARASEGAMRWQAERSRLVAAVESARSAAELASRALGWVTDARTLRAPAGGVVVRVDHAGGTDGLVDAQVVLWSGEEQVPSYRSP